MTDSHASVAIEPPPQEPRHDPFHPPTTSTQPHPNHVLSHQPQPPPASPAPQSPSPEREPFPQPSDSIPRKQLSASSARRSPPEDPLPSPPSTKPNPRRPARPNNARRTPLPVAAPPPSSSKLNQASVPRRDAVTGKYYRAPPPPPSTTATSLGRADTPQPSVPVGKAEPVLLPDNGDATSVLGISREQTVGTVPVPSGSLDEYREGCLKLEKIRHAKVFEAEKRRLFHETSVENEYQRNVHAAVDEYLRLRTTLVMKLLRENSCKVKHVQGLRYKIIGDESSVTGWQQRKHEMSLRGRAVAAESSGDNGNSRPGGRSALEEDGVLAEIERENGVREKEKRGRRGKNDNRQKVKVHIEVEESEALHDLALIRGEKRPREPEPVAERRTKKRK